MQVLKTHAVLKEIEMHLTLKPTTESVAKRLLEAAPAVLAALKLEMPKLEVADNDIVLVVEKCTSAFSSDEHVEGLLKTDNPLVTAQEIVNTLAPIINFPFEVSRIPVGNWLVEMQHENEAQTRGVRRNWASNY